MNRFSANTCQHIKYYVYGLVDPRTERYFYVGKGCGNRCFEHVKCAIKNENESTLKLNTIRDIINSGLEVKTYILTRELPAEDEAYRTEAVCIALANGKKCVKINKELTNVVEGHHAELHTPQTAEEVEIYYSCPDTELIEGDKFILLNINRSFNLDDDDLMILENAKSWWRINLKKIDKVNYVCVVCNDIIRLVFKIVGYNIDPKNGKVEFKGEVIKNHQYKNTNISKYIKFNQNPVRYYGI